MRRRRDEGGRYTVSAPGIDKSTSSFGGALIYAQRVRVERQKDGTVLTYTGHSVRA
jgi:hypothetical protein